MAAVTEVKVPDIGDFKDIPVIEIHVKPGDKVKAEDSLITLESEKAALDVPSTVAGPQMVAARAASSHIGGFSPRPTWPIAESSSRR